MFSYGCRPVLVAGLCGHKRKRMMMGRGVGIPDEKNWICASIQHWKAAAPLGCNTRTAPSGIISYYQESTTSSGKPRADELLVQRQGVLIKCDVLMRPLLAVFHRHTPTPVSSGITDLKVLTQHSRWSCHSPSFG